jgi:hypothetical protein
MTKENKSNMTETSSPGLPDWMVFPTLAEVFDPTPSEAIAHMTARHKEYQSRAATGSASDRVRDRLIAESYAHTYRLLQNLEEQRQGFLKKEATTAAKAR